MNQLFSTGDYSLELFLEEYQLASLQMTKKKVDRNLCSCDNIVVFRLYELFLIVTTTQCVTSLPTNEGKHDLAGSPLIHG